MSLLAVIAGLLLPLLVPVVLVVAAAAVVWQGISRCVGRSRPR
jgi:hypothetical protein